MNEDRSVMELGWAAFRPALVVPGSGPLDEERLECAFYAGATFILSLCRSSPPAFLASFEAILADVVRRADVGADEGDRRRAEATREGDR